jgi:hypothetical protein
MIEVNNLFRVNKWLENMCDFIYQSWIIILEWHTQIENLDYIKDILQNIPFIIATILIALLFQFLTYIDEPKNRELINQIVKKKISKIIPFKGMTFAFILALILPGYLEYKYFILDIVVSIVYVVIIIYLLSRSFFIWDYMTNQDIREEIFEKLLKNLTLQDNDFIEIWGIIWSEKSSENIRDSKSFKIWKSSLDKYWKTTNIGDNELDIIALTIEDFTNNLENRTLTFLRREGYIDWLLETHYVMWSKSYELIDGREDQKWLRYNNIFTAFHNLLCQTLKIMINHNSSNVLHNKVKVHLDKCAENIIGISEHKYIERWVEYFYIIFNDTIISYIVY